MSKRLFSKRRVAHPEWSKDSQWGFVSPGETRWPAAASVVGVMVLQMVLPDRLTFGPFWAIPALEGAVLIALLIVGPTRASAEEEDARWIALGLTGILIAANLATLGLLMHHLLRSGDPIGGRTLIYSAVAVWFTGVVSYGILYWEIDRGGPATRCSVEHFRPDFFFPQMDDPHTAETDWSPRYIDYLYISLTNSTAFSPTDALPLTARAKLVMALQSLASLATVAVVGARAVNILK